MAKNTGTGRRRGAVKNRYQLFNPITGLWSIFSPKDGLLRTKKSSGKAKGIKIGTLKRR